MNGDLYIYGGKRRFFEYDSYGDPIYAPHADIVFGDLYQLRVLNINEEWKLSWPQSTDYADGLVIPQDRRVFASVKQSAITMNASNIDALGDGVYTAEGMCIANLVVHVRI